MSNIKFSLAPVKKKRSRVKRKGNEFFTISGYKKDVEAFLSDYVYQTELTEHLDNLSGVKFNQELINEIVLWKVNRYALLSDQILSELNTLTNLRRGQHCQSKTVLNKLLKTRGIDLPMASAILRFRNPCVFQIIDRHAYRAVYGEKYPLYPASPNHRKINLYFEYLDKLIEISNNRNLEYKMLDRLLYEFDKQINGQL